MLNVHALGGREMMVRTSDAVKQASEREGLRRPLILGVTVLTSHSQQSLDEVGIDRSIEDEVTRLARLCSESGLDGVVASPLEIRSVRGTVSRKDFVVLVPGVRPAGSDHNDQSRVMTPREAINEGATFIVVGRPIVADKDPVAAARRIIEQLEQKAPENV
jgi:orotidine-5'-phosphate decarboxylase